ncbi:MAG: UDP-glucose/GDP-mannose dehydrogenase family protein [Croceitalea sp.]|nr:UDP-glucose/GDP-mannose dehydrogenase family protein [Croceitalea sp.]MBT8237418.1 UDP-glucose/GDP-mannose dehydrogenase family protein [Croceitalea sp.]NNL08786.1 UDP-glucose/GDP-mannose dehydrogenase family protein [Croceitalea sp.]NNM17980.1 UDP-glucose/GDP-mannose dehydrogenase family protein [Croceitalea sp.]
MNIAVVGTGYVGLVTGTCFAETGINVVCVDIDKKKVEMLRNGEVPIYEPGLDALLERNIDKQRISFTTSLAKAIKDCDAVFIAVGTPPDEDGSADLKYVLGVAREIGQHMEDYKVVITKSTVPVGTSYKVKAALEEELEKRGVRIPFDVASNPEFLKEGSAVDDFLKPDRIVVGIESKRAEKVMRRLYKPFLMNGHPLLFMDIFSSEMTKYAANSMLATKISFMNDIANLCELVGANVDLVRKGIGSDARIGNKFIYPGTGYGGSCFPKDVQALVRTADEYGHSLEVLKAVEAVNYRQKSVLVEKIKKHFGNNLKDKQFGLWGLAFKPKTDDMREAPSLVIIEQLKALGATIRVYDPVAMEEAKHSLGDSVEYAKDEYDACIDADAMILVTEWSEFRMPNFRILEKLMKERTIFDGRNVYDPEEMEEIGFNYYSIGREVIKNTVQQSVGA